MEKTIREELEKFLFENNCFSQFCINLLEQKHLTFDEYVERYLEEYRLSNNKTHIEVVRFWNLIFLKAFNYGRSLQGEKYWINIYYKWEKEY